jgi:capsule polysaccharide export protein KpsE/RkpR
MSKMEEGKDICYGCGKVQDYRTMEDVTEDSFAIFCDDCHPEVKKLLSQVESIDKAIQAHRESIATGGGSYFNRAIIELQKLAGKKEKELKKLGYNE